MGDKIIEVYHEGLVLYSKGIGFEPNELIKVADGTYFRRHRNRLLLFKPNEENGEMRMHFIHPTDGKIQSTFDRIKDGKKIPLELMVEGLYYGIKPSTFT